MVGIKVFSKSFAVEVELIERLAHENNASELVNSLLKKYYSYDNQKEMEEKIKEQESIILKSQIERGAKIRKSFNDKLDLWQIIKKYPDILDKIISAQLDNAKVYTETALELAKRENKEIKALDLFFIRKYNLLFKEYDLTGILEDRVLFLVI